MEAIDLCSGDEDVEYSTPLTEEIDFVGAIKTDWETLTSKYRDYQSPSKDHPAAYSPKSSQELGYVSLLSDDENDHAAEDQAPECRVERSLSIECLSNDFTEVNNEMITEEQISPESKFRKSPSTEKSNQRNKPVEKSTAKKICKAVSYDKETKQREKILNKAMKENHKSLKPKECMKYIFTEIGSELLNRPHCSRILEVLHSSGAQHQNRPPPFSESCIGWIRKCPRYLVTEEGQLTMSSESFREPQLLTVMDMDEVEELMKTKCLNSRIKFLRDASGCQVTLIVYGSKDYFRKQTNKNKANWKRQVLGDGSPRRKNDSNRIMENDFDYYITSYSSYSVLDSELYRDLFFIYPKLSTLSMLRPLSNCLKILELLFEESTCCTKAESAEELAQIILQSTKAVAETPFKLEKFAQDEKANFYMHGDNRECVSVDKNGNGSLRLWCQSLTKFPKAGLETAQAICEKYPSPACLIRMLESETEENAVKILSDLAVRRAAGPLASTRRIGPELANKIFIFFTSTQGLRQLI